jgi:hypothetical protein
MVASSLAAAKLRRAGANGRQLFDRNFGQTRETGSDHGANCWIERTPKAHRCRSRFGEKVRYRNAKPEKA